MNQTEIQTSAAFKQQTIKAITGISLFVLTYVLMLLAAVTLTALCVYGGLEIVKSRPSIIVIALGIGLVSFGVLIVIFLLKFIFKSHRVDRSLFHEIKKSDQPELFKLIEEIVVQVNTDFPKKVYLSPEVNASVFYDSSFWSMFFPIKKNLHIGMGLVNAITREELKGILAHEFGHFSQRTMKLGSYVYQVNQVIFNMLYDNESFDKLIASWARISGYFAIFVVLAVKLIEGIQWILKQLYDVVNKNYLGLSREMEFHADKIAASVTGPEPLINSLLRTSFADHSFSSVLNFYEGKREEELKSDNFFKDHVYTMQFLAQESNLPIVNGLPEVSLEELNKFNKSKLIIKDQWASHPSTEERIAHLKNYPTIKTENNTSPAIDIFVNPDEIQSVLTLKLFRELYPEKEPKTMASEAFNTAFKEEYDNNSFAKLYNGYYDNKNPLSFDTTTGFQTEAPLHISELFSEQKVDLVYQAIGLQQDMETVKQITEKIIQVKTFDYDGKKYSRKEAAELLKKINIELEIINEKIKENDIRIFEYFKRKESWINEGTTLKNLYDDLFEFDQQFDTEYDIYLKLSEKLQFVNYVTPEDEIRANFNSIKSLEKELKSRIKEMMEHPEYQPEITKEMKDTFEKYLFKPWRYFGNENYFDKNLEMLFSVMHNYAYLLSRKYFLRKKKILDYQAELQLKTLSPLHRLSQ